MSRVTITSEFRLLTQVMGRPGDVLLGDNESNREVVDRSQTAWLPVFIAQSM
ncbi:hypothetical protein SAMN06265222_101910 [Neorhodopirellula lusitana]|uniref:Uncharacterized protein n=1 Tax=Neorhodopirellula lusitana TaxID=445327 RepID=A0ABY1PUG9_9BACT|nr:hypothetical protein SAMN06265222_101910 [Neorhodopirellula lusitana]